MKQSISLVGPGRVGCAVTRRLFEAGFPVASVIGRNHIRTLAACRFIGCPEAHAAVTLSSAQKGDIVLLAVPDNTIAAVASQLRRLSADQPNRMALIHFSGVYEAAVMNEELHPEQTLLSLHPLISFASADRAYSQLVDCPFILEGNKAGILLGRNLTSAIGARSFAIESRHKAAYHAGASMASNFTVTLLAAVRDVLSTCGIPKAEALPLLKPLINTTIDNIFTIGPEEGLTGPIVRGDDQTVAKHLAAFKEHPDDISLIYLILARQTLKLAESSGRLDFSAGERLQELINSAICEHGLCSDKRNAEE